MILSTDTPPPMPLVPGDWQALTAAEAARTIAQLDRHLAAVGLAAPPFSQQCRLHGLHGLRPSFYPGWLLISGQADLRVGGGSGIFDILLGPRFFWCLDGTSPMLHFVNAGLQHEPFDEGQPAAREGVPLAVLEPQRSGPDYLRFFCHSVRGERGAFRVVESVDDLLQCGAHADAQALADRLRPLRMGWKDEARRVLAAEATLLYGGTLFAAEFEINAHGVVNMRDDHMLADEVAPAEVTQRWLRNMQTLARKAS